MPRTLKLMSEAVEDIQFLTEEDNGKKNYKIKGGIQANARSARLKIIQKYCLKNNIIHLFYGHHLNDNLETFVLRKVSGSNIEGLNSINFLAVNLENFLSNFLIIKKSSLSFLN